MAASSRTPTFNYVGDGNVDGDCFGRTGGKIGFYGKTPVVKNSTTVTALVTTPTATDIATAVNSLITRLQSVGLIT